MLAHVDALDADILAVEDRINELVAPFADHYDNRGGTQRAVRNHIRSLKD